MNQQAGLETWKDPESFKIEQNRKVADFMEIVQLLVLSTENLVQLKIGTHAHDLDWF